MKFESIILHIELKWAKTNQTRFKKYLRKKGIEIGDNFKIYGDIKSILIDTTRPSLVTIGHNVSLNSNFKLLTHDFVTHVFINKFHEFIPSSGRVKIGNNVGFGMDCTVLKGVTIGDNCFIGNGSIVSKDIPSNSIAVGRPAKVISSLEDYFKKRKEKCIEEALIYARSIQERHNRRPVITDFWEEFPLFINGEVECPELPIKSQLGSAYEYYKKYHKAIYNGFEDFLKNAGV